LKRQTNWKKSRNGFIVEENTNKTIMFSKTLDFGSVKMLIKAIASKESELHETMPVGWHYNCLRGWKYSDNPFYCTRFIIPFLINHVSWE